MAPHPSITKSKFLQVAQVFDFFTRNQAVMFFKGHRLRDKRVETLLPHFVKRGKLTSCWHEGRKVYSVPRKGRHNIEHGLACTECLIRFTRSHPCKYLYPEKRFKAFRIVPEWAIRYDAGLLLFEFCTENNFSRRALMRRKVRLYGEEIETIEGSLGEKVAVVVFVFEAIRKEVERFVKELEDCHERLVFTDYEAFKKVEWGKQLSAPIYIWGKTGEVHSLI